MIWLIRFKAAMGIESSLNMDGSEYIYATGVVYASSQAMAIKELTEHLNSDGIDFLPNFASAEEYTDERLGGSAEEIGDIKRCIARVNENNKVVLANALSSEAYDYLHTTKGVD